jgi:hypothetical protein
MGSLDWIKALAGTAARLFRPRGSRFGGISFEGGDGDTIETAVVVRGAGSDLAGTYGEFAWLVNKYGEKDKDWKLISHSHGQHEDRDIDTFEIELKSGTRLCVYFDCTESFGT